MTEAPEDFSRDRLPTLDFVLWMIDGILFHSYYEKSMKSQLTVMQRSAMSENQRIAILSNKLRKKGPYRKENGGAKDVKSVMLYCPFRIGSEIEG